MDYQGKGHNKVGRKSLSGWMANFFYITCSEYFFFFSVLFLNTVLRRKKTTTPSELLPFRQKMDSSC